VSLPLVGERAGGNLRAELTISAASRRARPPDGDVPATIAAAITPAAPRRHRSVVRDADPMSAKRSTHVVNVQADDDHRDA